MTENKSEYKTSTPLLPMPMTAQDPFAESNKIMYHGINSGLFLYGSAWTSAIMMAWFMFLGYVPSGAIQWVLIGIMILIGILNYPVKASQNPKPKEDKKDEKKI